MAIVAPDDPIFWTDGANAQYQFGSELSNPFEFRSLLPGADLASAMQVDNTLGQGFGAGWPSLEELGQDIQQATGDGQLADDAIHAMVTSNQAAFFAAMRNVAQYDVVRSMRAVVGQVATTIGFARNVMNVQVRNTYRRPLEAVAGTMDMVNQVFSSPYFQQALDGITMIPIVGWIIRVVVDLLKLAVRIAEAIRKSNRTTMNAALAQRMHVPMISEDRDLQVSLNQYVMQNTLRRIQTFALFENFMPPHRSPPGTTSAETVKAMAARDPESGDTYKDEDGVTSDLTSAWYVMGKLGGGTGFIPGTSEIMRAVEFKTRLTGNIPTNTGRFLPTPTQACAYLWQTAQKGGPAMFMLPTHELEAEWNAYVFMLLDYAERCVRKGFTGSETGYPCSDKEWDLDKAKEVKIGFGVSHLDEFRVFLKRQFWARGSKRDSYPHPAYNPNLIAAPSAWYYENTVYAHALRSMRDRQMSIVGGFDAFLVTPMKVIDVDGQERKYDNGSAPVFRAFHNDPAMVDKWETTIREVLNHATLWKHVNWRDVPEGMYKGESLRQILKLRQPGMQLASQYGPPVIPGGPSDFPPPTPPPIVGGDQGLPGVRPLPPSIGGVGGWAGWLLGGALVLGTAGVGIEAYQRFGKGLVKRFRK